jgi:adenosylmethionine-8-amino-7-oxononanoate aminotransferase
MALAKGLTGGYLPLAATLVREEIFAAFLGNPVEETTFFYGHSYCGNPLGCAAALASLDLFEEERVLESLGPKIHALDEQLRAWRQAAPWVHEVRQCGLIAGIELRRPDGSPFAPGLRVGAAVTEKARRHGLLTRPIRDVLVLMPPLSVTGSQLADAVHALERAAEEVCAAL